MTTSSSTANPPHVETVHSDPFYNIWNSNSTDTSTQTVSRYPCPSHIQATLSVPIRLTSKNYLLWESLILSLIQSQGRSGFIDVSCPSPPQQLLMTITNIYGPHDQQDHRVFFEEIQSPKQIVKEPWLIIVDFNINRRPSTD